MDEWQETERYDLMDERHGNHSRSNVSYCHSNSEENRFNFRCEKVNCFWSPPNFRSLFYSKLLNVKLFNATTNASFQMSFLE